jgi:hypothetical protein
MEKRWWIIFIVIGLLICIGITIYKNLEKNPSSPPSSLEEMKSCESPEDCVPVGCGCSCSGCGGFDYDEIINKKYTEEWYSQQECSPPEICPQVCCQPMEIKCENNVCGVNYLETLE